MAIKKSELYSSLWRSCDELRGGMDASQYKDYVLVLLFVKYVSDKAQSQKNYDLDVPKGGSFADLVALKGDKEIGDKMNTVVAKLAGANDLKGVIDVADWNDPEKLGRGKEMTDRLSTLVGIFEKLDFRANRADGDDLLGDAYEYLMRHFATESGKSKGQFYTPAEVSRVMAHVVGVTGATSNKQTIHDPTCGSGSLLLRAHDEAKHATGYDLALYGQEKDNATKAAVQAGGGAPADDGGVVELKAGYKLTEVGVIPEDWKVEPLSALLDFRNGVNAEKGAYGSGIRFINVLEVITKSHVVAIDIPGRIRLERTACESYGVQVGDILFNRTSETQEEVGLAAVYLGNEPVVFGGFVIRGRPRKHAGIDAVYAGYGLRAPAIRAQIVARGQGAIRANIGQTDLRTVRVPLPPPDEQRAIADALSDVDALIAALDRLIAKKRDIKQAAMQQLLTGQTRLPGFEREWVTKAVGHLGDVLAGKALNAGGVGTHRPYLRTANVLDGRIDLNDVLTMPFTAAEFAQYALERGDVLLNEGQSIELVGRCSMYRDE